MKAMKEVKQDEVVNISTVGRAIVALSEKKKYWIEEQYKIQQQIKKLEREWDHIQTRKNRIGSAVRKLVKAQHILVYSEEEFTRNAEAFMQSYEK